MLVGRERESARLDALVAAARDGRAGTVLVHGDPGAGKTALLQDLVQRTADAVVLRTQGVEVEAPLAFAALHRMLLPLARLRDDLAVPQARALRIAFGEEEGPAVDPFLVAVATHSLLTEAAEEQVVLCLVDDAHWLDQATADALLFASRRLEADRVVIVLAARDGTERPFRPEGIESLRLGGLSDDAARALLEERLDAVHSDDVTERLIADSAGNPLALLELPLQLSPAQLEGSAPLPDQLELTDRVEQSFVDRCRRLPEAVQLLLLVAAADDTATLSVIHEAASRLGAGEQELEAAVRSGLLRIDLETVRVRHPLVRSAVYQSATPQQRRRVHQALADALTVVGDEDRGVWHRAAAAEGPDDDVAEALARAARRAEGRGGYAAALAAYARAASLSTVPARRGELHLGAARNAWACGQTSRARHLLASAHTTVTDPLGRADLARLQGRIEVNIGSAHEAHRIFVEAADAVRDVDPSRALEMAVAAAIMRTYGADSGAVLPDGDELAQVQETDSPRTVCLKQMFLAMTSTAAGDWSAAVASLDAAAQAGAGVHDLDVLGNLGNAALQLGDERTQQHYYSVALSRARETGGVMTAVYALQRLCFGHLVRGEWTALRSCAEEALELAGGVGQRALSAPPLAWLTLLSALQDGEDYETNLSRLESVLDTHPQGILTDPVHDLTRWAKGARASAAGDAFGALHHLRRLRLPALARMAATDRVDAAIRAGEPALARTWVEELADFAAGTARPWALAVLTHGRAVTAEADQADELFRTALEQHGGTGHAYDEARTRLAYGEWLRRAQRRVDARDHLRHAVEMFGDLRAAPLVARATAELRASGETARKRDPSTLVKLTPMELKVAQLVASGLSNKDVAAQIWVSPRTVAFHLRNVFAKAGISSRGELARLDLT